MTFLRFQFAAAVHVAAAARAPDDAPAAAAPAAASGRLVCSDFESKEGAALAAGCHSAVPYEELSPPTLVVDPETKFILNLSLATSSTGGVSHGAGLNAVTYAAVGPPVAVFELRCETAGTLLLRGVLAPEHPLAVAADAAARALAARLADERRARRALEAGKRERLECDLTGDDDGAPRWSQRLREE
jgi:hypothetical protein